MEQLKLNRIKSVAVCMANVMNKGMEQPEKVQELSDYLSLPDSKTKALSEFMSLSEVQQ